MIHIGDSDYFFNTGDAAEKVLQSIEANNKGRAQPLEMYVQSEVAASEMLGWAYFFIKTNEGRKYRVTLTEER